MIREFLPVWIEWAKTWLFWFEALVLVYFLVLNSSYILFTYFAAKDFIKYFKRRPYTDTEDLFANPITPSVSIVVGAYNEEVGILDCVHSVLALRYPELELIVVDDGSTDSTFQLLLDNFDLVEIYRQPVVDNIKTVGKLISIWTSRSNDSLFVVRKTNGAARADSLNMGIKYATKDLLCLSDADSVFEPNGILMAAKPFVEDPDHVVGTGGVIRPSNGCTIDDGVLIDTGVPPSYIGRVQVIEYLRSFLIGKAGWNVLGAMTLVSGAFGLYRRDLVQQLGGLDTHSMAEDMELTLRIHRFFLAEGGQLLADPAGTKLPSVKTGYRITFVTEPVCWTEVPPTRKILARQRLRWSRGLAEVMWKYRTMIFNPVYKRVGMLAMPYYFFFELLGPVIELLGFLTITTILTLFILGKIFEVENWLLNTPFAIAIAAVALCYGALVSMAALAVEEFSFRRMNKWRDLWWTIWVAFTENIGFRQMHTWWRTRGLIQFFRGRKASWGVMTRAGTKKLRES